MCLILFARIFCLQTFDRYRTTTIRDWRGDAIDYTVYFQVFSITKEPQVGSGILLLK